MLFLLIVFGLLIAVFFAFVALKESKQKAKISNNKIQNQPIRQNQAKRQEDSLSTAQKQAVEIARNALFKKFPQGKIGNEVYKFYSISQDPENPNWWRVIFDVELASDKAVWITVDVESQKVVKFIQTRA